MDPTVSKYAALGEYIGKVIYTVYTIRGICGREQATNLKLKPLGIYMGKVGLQSKDMQHWKC